MDIPETSSNQPIDLTNTGLFCLTCMRNQQLFISALASWMPSADDPAYDAYERELPRFRRNLEEQYPQVCDKCEPRVQARISETEYDAKVDHIRHMMDRSRVGRANRRARNRNWRSLFLFAGAFGFWSSIVGELVWHLVGALEDRAEDASGADRSATSCVQLFERSRRIPRDCSLDFAPYAGYALAAGLFSIWWNPKLRLRVSGRRGRLVKLKEYYLSQLVIMVARCVFWEVFKDPSSNGLQPSLCRALHIFMISLLTLVRLADSCFLLKSADPCCVKSVVMSRFIVEFDTRPLVNWSRRAPAVPKNEKPQPSHAGSSVREEQQQFFTPVGGFPIEKLATPRPASPTPESVLNKPGLDARPLTPPQVQDVDDMDWSPSYQQAEIRPTVSVQPRTPTLMGPQPFYGRLPPAPKPPSWAFLNQPAQKPIQQVIERNPFHHNLAHAAPASSQGSRRKEKQRNDAMFAPPRFFPASDYTASTGLEAMFDRAFTIKSPEDEQEDNRNRTAEGAGSTGNLRMLPSLSLALLLAAVFALVLSQKSVITALVNYATEHVGMSVP